MPEVIRIFDTTLRDGEQSPGCSMDMEEKLRLAYQLERLGVDIIEAGFPIASEGDFESVKLVASKIKGPQVAGLCRANSKDIERAWEALKTNKKPRIHTFIATSDIHLEHKLRKTRDQVLNEAAEAVRFAKGFTDNVEFSAEDASRSDPNYLCMVLKAVIEAGAETVNIPDTVGYALPQEFGDLIATIKEQVPNINNATIAVHCHNDLGLAVANSIAAVLNGARQVECTINGVGERAGNCSLEEFVMAVHTRSDLLDFKTNITTDQIYPTSRLLTHITGMEVQRNKAIVGANAFAHEAGIHQDGLLKKTTTYEIISPKTIGLTDHSLVLGKHSGRHALKVHLERLGYPLSKEQLDQVFEQFKALADKKKEVFDEDLEFLADDVIRGSEKKDQKYELVSIEVSTGTERSPLALVKLKVEGEVREGFDTGDGPIDAIYKTIGKIAKTNYDLMEYQVKAVTGGTDAQGEVYATLKDGDIVMRGRGTHTDILVSSAKAYVDALNRLDFKKKTENLVHKK